MGPPLLSFVFEVTLIPVQTSTLLDPAETHCLPVQKACRSFDTEERRSAAAYRARGAPCWSWWMFLRTPYTLSACMRGAWNPLRCSIAQTPRAPVSSRERIWCRSHSCSRFLENCLLFLSRTLLIVSLYLLHFLYSFYNLSFLNSLRWDMHIICILIAK